jgi:hypothetical protein
MSSKIMRLGVLAATLVATCALAASANAANWHSNLGFAYTGATYGGTFAAANVAGQTSTLNVSGITLTCSAASAVDPNLQKPTDSTVTATGTNGPVTTGAVGGTAWGTELVGYPVSGHVNFTSCLSAGVGYTVTCDFILKATSTTALAAYGSATLQNAVTQGNLIVNCRVRLGTTITSTICKTITGSLTGSYTNPGTIPAGPTQPTGAGLLTVNSGAGTLGVGPGGTGACAIPNGNGNFTGTAPGGGLQFNVTAVQGTIVPVIWVS